MEETCQRCHETLRAADRYCAACGMPQLTFVVADMPSPVEADAAQRDGGQVSGLDPLSAVHGIAWRPALSAALTLAVPAGILCFGILPVGLLGMIGAAAWAVGLYSKRARLGGLSAGTGARIGLITGLFASWLTVGLYGLSLWVSRFVLHQGGEWDSLWLGQVEKSNQQMLAQMGTANAQSAQVAQSLHALMISSEGRAGLPLSGLMVIAGILLLLAAAGGALGARLVASARAPRV